MIIAQITDMHITTDAGKCQQRYATAEHLARAVAHLNALTPRPDVALATGDLVDAGGMAEYERLRDLLMPLSMPVYLIPGNHDDRANIATVFSDHAYLPENGDFLHYVIDDWPVRLIALDTLVPGKGGGDLCAARLSWLDARLAEPRDKPLLIFMHHPPFATGIQYMDAQGLASTDAFAALLSRHEPVERIVCGHLHRAITQRFANTVALTAPATAHQLALDLRSDKKRLSAVMEPPGCMLHCWMGDGGGLVSHLSYIGTDFQTFEVSGG